MNRALLAFLLAASVVAVAQEPKPAPAAAAAKTPTKAEKKAAKKAAEVKPAAPAPAPASAPKAAPAAAAKAAATSTAILANQDSKTYHRADCKVAAKMKEANRTSFGSAAEAARAGFKPCKVCKP